MLAEAATAAPSRNEVIAAIKQASVQTGTDFRYMLDTAMRESSLKSDAKSGTSSATGLFQFIDQTWLGLVKQHGAQFGLGAYASQISKGSDGRYHVDGGSNRQAILALRKDPKISALMEGAYCNQAKCAMEDALGRDVGDGDLYAAHFLGTEGATHLIKLASSNPSANAAAAFPAAASANRSVFYHSDGTPKTAREVYDWARHQSGGKVKLPESSAPAGTPALRDTTVTEDAGYAGSDSPQGWAGLLFAGNTHMPLVSMTKLPSAPFALTPNILQVLSSMTPDNPHKSGLFA